ncbi:MAG: alpha-L-fucosidase [Gemmatimonadetes bacterium]|nr:alpha-L-fucosidase [Gemmatimonadota bacterium]
MKRRDFLAAGSALALKLGVRRRNRSFDAGPQGAYTRPIPTRQQFAWQRDELAMFIHFGVNTFMNREWGDGKEDPRVFDPTRFDARQWARIAKAAGFRAMILTAKHHDGFCLWPTASTNHSVRSSPWRTGAGDVVREFVDACRAEGLGAGLYLSPWDRHEPSYGDSPRYNDFYIDQLTELLTQYGPITEVWFDGANGEGPNGKRQLYDWPRIHRTVHSLQPGAVMFSDAGPDVRWIGNERGIAGETSWSMMDPERVPYAGFDGPGVRDALLRGDARGTVWRPGEADVSIRPGWFWHPEEDDNVRSVENLLDLYFASVGRNSKLLLNVPPTNAGLLPDTDARHLTAFGERLRTIFATNYASGARVRASGSGGTRLAPAQVVDGDPETFWSAPTGAQSGWVELELAAPATFDIVCLQEAIAHGQHIANYRVEGWMGARWTTLSWGTTIGYKKLDRIPQATTPRVRVTVEFAYDTPRLATVALYRSNT